MSATAGLQCCFLSIWSSTFFNISLLNPQLSTQLATLPLLTLWSPHATSLILPLDVGFMRVLSFLFPETFSLSCFHSFADFLFCSALLLSSFLKLYLRNLSSRSSKTLTHSCHSPKNQNGVGWVAQIVLTKNKFITLSVGNITQCVPGCLVVACEGGLQELQ